MITKEKYPKAFELYKNWIKAETKIRTNVDDQFIDGMETDDLVAMSINRASRDRYDFLDYIKVIVSVWNDGQGWRYRVDDGIFPVVVSIQGERKLSEEKAFTEAFDRLERK